MDSVSSSPLMSRKRRVSLSVMQKYIKNTPESESLRFGLGFAEFCALRDILAKDMIADAFFLAFSYGRAKGYRLARSEKKGG